MTTTPDELANVRYIVDDVAAAVDFYTTHLGFTLQTNAVPAFADVIRGPLRLLLSRPASSSARATPDNFTNAGRNRIYLIVTELVARTLPATRRRALFPQRRHRRSRLTDPADNLIELFEPAPR